MKNPIKVKQGKTSRSQGAAFELRVRTDLEEKGFIVDKWTNQVEFKEESDGGDWQYAPEIHTVGKLVKSKAKWNNFTKSMMMGSGGFPDFVCWHNDLNREVEKRINGEPHSCVGTFGVESKMEGELTKLEKEKCAWLLEQGIFSKILIASKHKTKNRIHIEYEDFKMKYYRFYNDSKD